VPYSLIGIPLVWLYMLLRHVISVRAILASLIAVLLVLLYTFILDYLGWISLPWEKEILLTNVWYPWLAIIEVIGVGLLCYFPIRKASFLTGVLYIIGIGVCCALSVCYWVWFR
jgi:hypothetical protein